MNLPECTACAKCCHCNPLLVRGVDENCGVPEGMWLPLKHPRYFGAMKMNEGTCIALDPVTRLCTLYYTGRPKVCSELERGSPACLRCIEDNP